MITCYTELNWPQLPKEMVSELIEWSETAEDIHPGKRVHRKYYFQGFAAPDYLNKWVSEHIPLDNSYEVFLQRFIDIDICPIHTDNMRDTSFNYLLCPSDAITCFYDDDNNLIQEVTYKDQVWYHHQSQVKHNVKNINNYRLAVTIFQPIPEEIYMPKYLAKMQAEFETLPFEMQEKIRKEMSK